jgi:hypothetical protein
MANSLKVMYHFVRIMNLLVEDTMFEHKEMVFSYEENMGDANKH